MHLFFARIARSRLRKFVCMDNSLLLCGMRLRAFVRREILAQPEPVIATPTNTPSPPPPTSASTHHVARSNYPPRSHDVPLPACTPLPSSCPVAPLRTIRRPVRLTPWLLPDNASGRLPTGRGALARRLQCAASPEHRHEADDRGRAGDGTGGAVHEGHAGGAAVRVLTRVGADPRPAGRRPEEVQLLQRS